MYAVCIWGLDLSSRIQYAIPIASDGMDSSGVEQVGHQFDISSCSPWKALWVNPDEHATRIAIMLLLRVSTETVQPSVPSRGRVLVRFPLHGFQPTRVSV